MFTISIHHHTGFLLTQAMFMAENSTANIIYTFLSFSFNIVTESHSMLATITSAAVILASHFMVSPT